MNCLLNYSLEFTQCLENRSKDLNLITWKSFFPFQALAFFSSVFIIHICGIENARVFCCWKGIDRISPSKVAQKHCKINLITNHTAFLLLLILCFLQRNFEFCNTTFLSGPRENLNCVFLGSWLPPFFDIFF